MESFLKAAEKKIKRESNKSEKLDIEKPFVDYVASHGCIAFKLIILNKRGFPDRTVLVRGGKIFFVEFKRENKEPDPLQIKVKNILVKLGFGYYVCYKQGQAEAIFDRYMDSP